MCCLVLCVVYRYIDDDDDDMHEVCAIEMDIDPHSRDKRLVVEFKFGRCGAGRMICHFNFQQFRLHPQSLTGTTRPQRRWGGFSSANMVLVVLGGDGEACTAVHSVTHCLHAELSPCPCWPAPPMTAQQQPPPHMCLCMRAAAAVCRAEVVATSVSSASAGPQTRTLKFTAV